MSVKSFKETLYDGIHQEIRIDKLYFEEKTDHQHLMIFHNSELGRVMTLDGVVQTTEADEFIYHEMMTHVPILGHGKAKRILIIGGGDGGMLREVVKHDIDSVVQVEIDQAVVDMAIKYLPNHSQGAYEDPRLNLVIASGSDFVKETAEKFDVIICDSTDPIGPGEVLFTEDFYSNAKSCLVSGGIMVTQNGVPFFQDDEVINTFKRMGRCFKDMTFYCAPVPTYTGGFMTFAWGTDDVELGNISLSVLKERFNKANILMKYYTPSIHQASFSLPQYVLNMLTLDEPLV